MFQSMKMGSGTAMESGSPTIGSAVAAHCGTGGEGGCAGGGGEGKTTPGKITPGKTTASGSG